MLRTVWFTIAVMASFAAAVTPANAWDAAPVEFRSRAVRPAADHSGVATSTLPASPPARRAAEAALDMPEMLYGYGRVSARDVPPLLDLRGLQRAGGASELLAADAFDDATAPAEAAPVPLARTEGHEDAITPVAEPAPPTPTGGYFVQVGAFSDPANAERVRIALLDVGSVTVEVRDGAGVALHRVRLGQWASRAEAELARDVIVERGFDGAMVTSDR